MLRPYFFACTVTPDAHAPAMTDLKRSLRLVDGLAMVVGIMVGSGIFRTPGLVAAQLGRPWLTFVAWIAGGALALVGALCFAELATRHPAAGGKYVYVREAFGPRAGFVVGWGEALATYPVAIAAIAVVAGEYVERLAGLAPGSARRAGVGLAALFMGAELAGVASGRWRRRCRGPGAPRAPRPWRFSSWWRRATAPCSSRRGSSSAWRAKASRPRSWRA